MPFGSEQKFIHANPIRKTLWALRGDFHIGRWIRHFHLQRVLRKFHFKTATILDAGCGTGQETFFLERQFPLASIEGIDVSQDNIKTCETIREKLGSRIKFYQADLQCFASPNRYDLILISNVLYSVPDYERALRNTLQSLSENGWIIIQDMNIANIHKRYGKDIRSVADAIRMSFTFEELLPILEQTNVEAVLKQKTCGMLGDFAHRGFGRVRTNPVLLNLFFPVLLFFGSLDTLITPKDGSGLLIVGKKG